MGVYIAKGSCTYLKSVLIVILYYGPKLIDSARLCGLYIREVNMGTPNS